MHTCLPTLQPPKLHTQAPSPSHCPPSPTAQPDSPASHTAPSHTRVPHIGFMLLTYTPSTLVHVTLPEIFHAGLLTPPSLCAPPIPYPPHTFFHTQVPACLPHWLSTLCKVTQRSLPSGTLASSHCLYTLLHTNSTQKAPVYFHCHPETFPSQPFPFTLFLLSGSPRASPSGPSAYAYCLLPFCPRLSCPQSHTYTHIKVPNILTHQLWPLPTHPTHSFQHSLPLFTFTFLSQISGTAPHTPKWEMATTPVFLRGESHGQRNLEGYSAQGRKEADMTEHLTQSLLSSALLLSCIPSVSLSLSLTHTQSH